MRQSPLLTVTQLTHAIKLSLEATFPLVQVQGEVSNFKRQASGHLYFSLKDAGAQIACVMFRGEAATMRTLPKEGDQVIVQAELAVYAPRGNYQLVVREMRLAGLGELLLKLEELKAKLAQRGWFDAAHKKPLPKFPRKIGVVTSPTGAVIQDILNVLSRRFAGFHLILNPVKVQGEGAAEEIAKAIEQFNTYDLVDVIIVARGGGSIEDLWAFNEEKVAEAIFRSKIPIISAVGHETDTTIADFVADVRAPTPSAAAEIVIAEKAHQIHHLTQLHNQLQRTIGHLLKQARQRLTGVARQPMMSSPYALLGVWMQRLDHLRNDTDQCMRLRLRDCRMHLESKRQRAAALRPLAKILHFKEKLRTLDQGLLHSIRQRIARNRQVCNTDALTRRLCTNWNRLSRLRTERLESLAAALKAIDPKNLLSRGYSIVLAEKDGSVISSVKSLERDQKLRLLLSDGEAKATVTQTLSK